MTMSDDEKKKSFWTSLPGILTGTAAVITAIVGIIAAQDGITTNHQPSEPEADAGIPKTVNEGDIVTLDGTNSHDPDGKIVGYDWVQTDGEPVILSSNYVRNPSFKTPDVSQDRVLTFKLRVRDNNDILSTPSTVTVTIKDVNQSSKEADSNTPPIADAGTDQIVNGNSLITLDGRASSDPNQDDTLTYKWVQVAGDPLVKLSNTNTAAPIFTTPNVSENVTFTFELEVIDNDGSSDIDTVNIIIKDNNNNDTQSPEKIALISKTNFIPEELRNPGLTLFTHSVEVRIEASPQTLSLIENVTYYPQPIVTPSDKPEARFSPKDNFAFSFNALKEFELKAKAYFKGGQSKDLSTFILLR